MRPARPAYLGTLLRFAPGTRQYRPWQSASIRGSPIEATLINLPQPPHCLPQLGGKMAGGTLGSPACYSKLRNRASGVCGSTPRRRKTLRKIARRDIFSIDLCKKVYILHKYDWGASGGQASVAGGAANGQMSGPAEGCVHRKSILQKGLQRIAVGTKRTKADIARRPIRLPAWPSIPLARLAAGHRRRLGPGPCWPGVRAPGGLRRRSR